MSRNPDPPKTITFRASPVLRARIDILAKSHGGSRTKAIQAALLKAGDPPQTDDVPSDAEVLRLLGESARSGNVSAMKELRAYHRERSAPTEADNPLDELANRRAARA